jgi:tetratricopeptide (TPR) repeat protein
MLVVVCGAAYANALDAGFVYDDLVNITQRASLRWDHLSLANWWAAVVDGPSKRPVALATFGLQYWLGLDSARAFHAVNVAIHLLNGLLVWRLGVVLMRRGLALGGRPLDDATVEAAALAAALVFISHPIQTQSVTYVVQRMNSLAATFQLASLLLYVRARRTGAPGRQLALFVAAAFAWLLALGSKESAAIGPVTLWLYEWYFERRLSIEFVRQSGAYLLLVGVPTAIAAFVLVAMSGYDPLGTYPEKDFTPFERLMSQPRVLVFYLSELLWPLPSRLSLLHPLEVSRTPLSPWTTLPAAVLITASIVACALAAPRWRLLSFCGLWFFVHLAIESTVVPLALAMEHRLYLPIVGPLIGLAFLGARAVAADERRRMLARGGVLILVGALALATHVRNRAWETPESLWRDVLAKYPNEFVAQLNLGFHLDQQGRHAEALVEYERARVLAPDDTRVLTNIGSTLARLGRHEEAIVELRRALEIDPDNPLAPPALGRALILSGRTDEAIEVFRESARRHNQLEAWVSLGRAQLLARDLDASRRSFLVAARGTPPRAEPQVGLGLVALELGQTDRAIGHFERALQLGPTAEIHVHLGLALWPERDQRGAIGHLENAHALAPDWPVALNNLAWMLATAQDAALRDGERALGLARRAVEVSGGRDAEILSTLAAALAANDRFDEALAVADQAAALAEARAQESLVDELAERRRRYVAGELHLEAEEGS